MGALLSAKVKAQEKIQMRCEVCGAPFLATEAETKCPRCREHKSFSTVPRSKEFENGKVNSKPPFTSNPRSSSATRTTAGFAPLPRKKESIRPDPPDSNTGKHEGLPLPGDGEPEVVLPSSVVLEGKYRLLNELGRGSMGTVFQAEDIALKRQVAVKFLLPELADSTECAIRFKREAIAMASIRNEHVAQIHAYGEDNETPYFVIEYLNGETVEHLIDSHNRRGFFIPVDDVVDIMVQTLYGLAAIHKAGAIHRDIKPGNIMLTVEQMRVVIMDFGLVRDVLLEDDMRTLAGTPAYIAPELVEGKPGADRSKLTDIYSLGTTFYELLTGSIPFGGDTWVEILQKHIAEMPLHPSVRRPGLPEVFDSIVLRAMSKDPSERYQNCGEFLDDLLDVQEMALPHDRRPSAVPPIVGRKSPRFGNGNSRVPSSNGHGSDSVRNDGVRSNSDKGFKATPMGSRGRLLVADVNPEFRTMVHSAAKSSVPGCRVHSATDGSIALDLLASIRPHVLVVDLALPEINGFELIASLVDDPKYDDLTIVVVSDTAGTKDATILKSMGASYFISKPIDLEEMSEILRPLLERPVSSTSIPLPAF